VCGVRWCDRGEGESCRFGESFKRLKNLVERLAILRKDGGKRERRNFPRDVESKKRKEIRDPRKNLKVYFEENYR